MSLKNHSKAQDQAVHISDFSQDYEKRKTMKVHEKTTYSTKMKAKSRLRRALKREEEEEGRTEATCEDRLKVFQEMLSRKLAMKKGGEQALSLQWCWWQPQERPKRGWGSSWLWWGHADTVLGCILPALQGWAISSSGIYLQSMGHPLTGAWAAPALQLNWYPAEDLRVLGRGNLYTKPT